MNILKEGVRSALVRLVRYIVFGIIALAIFWLIGLFTNKKANALVMKDQVFMPSVANQSQSHTFTSGNGSNYWFDFNFSSQWNNTSDYDLIGFRFTRNTSAFVLQQQGNNTVDYEVLNGITYSAILWDSNDAAQLCYTTSEIDNMFFCPIVKGQNYKGISIVTNVVNLTYYPNTSVDIQMYFEQNSNFFNYDSTEIINSNGQIVNQQTITNTTLTQQFQFIQQNDQQSVNTTSSGSLDTLSGKFNDMLNGWGGQWSTLTRVVFEPIQLLVNIGDTQNTCQPLRLRIPYVSSSTWGDYIIELPCMGNIYNGFFSNFMSVFSTIIVGLYCYRAIIYFVSTIKGVLDAEDDKLEVISL